MDRLILVLALAELLGLFLMPRLWGRVLPVTTKVGYTLLLLVPVLGPLAYVWILTWPNPQGPELRNDLPRGYYLHNQLSKRRDLDKGNKV
jgi:hypothetical protein